jgi:hypothetical protein
VEWETKQLESPCGMSTNSTLSDLWTSCDHWDQPPNTREEVPQKRREGSWEGTQFAEPTYFDDEFETVVQNDQSSHFMSTPMLEKLSNGCLSKVTASAVGEEVTHLVTRHVLNQQGGSAKGAALVADDDAKYGRRGHVTDT